MCRYNKTLSLSSSRPAEGTRILTRCSSIAALLLGGTFFCAISTGVQASPLDREEPSPEEILLAQRSIADSSAHQELPPPTIVDSQSPLTDEPSKVSSGRAFIYNLILPGTGHLYAGYKRGWAHLGVEGLTWVTYFYYHDRGTQKENQFEAFADDHWDYDKFISTCGCAGSPQDSIIRYFYVNNTQQYYEDIGKLEHYFVGWDDYSTQTSDSDNRRYYRGIRNDSNNFYKNARYAVVTAFVNRIVSAVDVLRLTKKEPSLNIGSDTTLHFKMRTKPFNSENAFGVRVVKKY
jgi:hypothetical protein